METLQTVGTWFASPSGQVAIVIAVFALTIVAFIADKVRSDIVAQIGRASCRERV